MEIGWGRKDQALRRIAHALNLGTDSLVFLDDNPAEIELIRQSMPEVECVLLPADVALRPACLDRIHSLDRLTLTAEDAGKTEQYRQNALRDAVRHEFGDLREYFHSLRTRIEIRPAGQELMPRAHQLFMKTNQFNVTTRRPGLGELQAAAGDAGHCLLMVRAEDRFGDLGWIGAVLLCGLDEAEVEIDSFVLSCRAMGRGIESAILNRVKSLCFAKSSCSALAARYIPTARNAPVRELFESEGFELVRTDADGTKHYRLERHRSVPTPCDWIDVITQRK